MDEKELISLNNQQYKALHIALGIATKYLEQQYQFYSKTWAFNLDKEMFSVYYDVKELKNSFECGKLRAKKDEGE